MRSLTLGQPMCDGTETPEKGLESRRTPGIMGSKAEVPSGAPEWVTAQLLEEAIEVWQPYYEHELTVEDALEITLSVGRLGDVISAEGGT
ncbi:MAG: hypothetical protein KAX19_13005 [Candidatus Brocadiae bacterium]|nr:hypothetical protein [Candidatus Brocadiia bacterium]